MRSPYQTAPAKSSARVPLTPLQQRYYQEIGRRVGEARVAAGLSRADVADLATATDPTCNRSAVQNIEDGRNRVPVDRLYAVSRALRLPLASLLPSAGEAVTR